jgi:hypothetical protein
LRDSLSECSSASLEIRSDLDIGLAMSVLSFFCV